MIQLPGPAPGVNQQGQYNVYMQPEPTEETRPEDANYNPEEEGLFSSSTILDDSGTVCEKGKDLFTLRNEKVNVCSH